MHHGLPLWVVPTNVAEYELELSLTSTPGCMRVAGTVAKGTPKPFMDTMSPWAVSSLVVNPAGALPVRGRRD